MTRSNYERANSIAFSVGSEHVEIPLDWDIDEESVKEKESQTQTPANDSAYGSLSKKDAKKRISAISYKSSKSDAMFEDKETHWISIYLLTAISCLAGVQFSVYFASLWPYLDTIDPGAGETFFGLVTASFSAGQAVSSPLFGYWMKLPLICGTIIMAVSNVVYAFVEAFPETKRRWVLLIARACIGAGSGIIGTMRAYAATASLVRDRAKAITLVTGSFVMGLTIGPAVQVAFTPIGRPGFTAGILHVDMYTAPAWFAIMANAAALILLLTIFKEKYAGIASEQQKKDPYFVLPKFDKVAAFICICTQFTLMFIITNLETVGSMYAMAMWNWTDKEAVSYNGFIQTGQGFMSLMCYVLLGWKLGKIISKGRERIGTMVGLMLGLLFHVITYPYSFLPHRLNYKLADLSYVNGSDVESSVETVGCETDYPWCEATRRVPLILYCTALPLTISVAFPLVNVSMNTLYSQILGPRRQKQKCTDGNYGSYIKYKKSTGTMQGFLLFAGSIARTIGPVFVAYLFKNYGPKGTWIMEIVVLSSTVILWIIFYRRLIPLEVKPKLKSGQFYRYKNGTKYRL